LAWQHIFEEDLESYYRGTVTDEYPAGAAGDISHVRDPLAEAQIQVPAEGIG
jgi:hypothetical protein